MDLRLDKLKKLPINLTRFLASFFMILFRYLMFVNVFGMYQASRLSPWIGNEFSSPAPNIVKWKVMDRWGGCETWIETGTYLGETTHFLKSKSNFVISLEPERQLFERAKKKFQNSKNVIILHGTSESMLLEAIFHAKSRGSIDFSFWLDGHFSEGFTYLGEVESPVIYELKTISENFRFEDPITIFIDDVRCFSKTNETLNGYPSLSFLVKFADKHSLFWVIEHDIFIMTNRL